MLEQHGKFVQQSEDLEPGIAFVGVAGFDRGVGVGVAAPAGYGLYIRWRRHFRVEGGTDGGQHLVADAVRDLVVQVHLFIELGDPLQVVANRLVAGDIGQRPDDGLEEARDLVRDGALDLRIGLQVHQPAVGLAVGGVALDSVERYRDRLVHQHAAVDKGGVLGGLSGPPRRLELVPDKRFAPGPGNAALLDQRIHFREPGRRKCPGKTAGRPGRKSQGG